MLYIHLHKTVLLHIKAEIKGLFFLTQPYQPSQPQLKKQMVDLVYISLIINVKIIS